MIGRLSGILLEKQPPHILLDVQGVGYELDAPMSTFYQLPSLGEKVTLHTHMVVREDAQLLYAFADKRSRELFRELIRLNGVGPKLALALMSGMDVDELVMAVQHQDVSALVKIPGVGKKTAERLLIELRDRFKAWDALPGAVKMSTWCRSTPRFWATASTACSSGASTTARTIPTTGTLRICWKTPTPAATTLSGVSFCAKWRR